MRHVTTFLALALVGGAAPVMAQQHQHRGDTVGRGMMGQEQEMMPGMALRAFAPAQLLAKRTDLGLTDDQVTRLERLQADAKREHDQAMASHDRYRDQMMEALKADAPDPTAIQGLMAGAHESMGQAHWAEMHAALMAMSVLTDAQRGQVRQAQPGMGMQHRHGQGRQ